MMNKKMRKHFEELLKQQKEYISNFEGFLGCTSPDMDLNTQAFLNSTLVLMDISNKELSLLLEKA
jgi:hypothetical protein